MTPATAGPGDHERPVVGRAEPFSRIWWRNVPGAALTGFTAGLLVYVAQAPWSRVLGAALVGFVVALVVLRSAPATADQQAWPLPPGRRPGPRVPPSPRWSLGGFDAMVDRDPFLATHTRARLAAIATGLLARRGVQPDAPAAVEMLGVGPRNLLFPTGVPEYEEDRTARRRPNGPELTAVLEALDRLGRAPR